MNETRWALYGNAWTTAVAEPKDCPAEEASVVVDAVPAVPTVPAAKAGLVFGNPRALSAVASPSFEETHVRITLAMPAAAALRTPIFESHSRCPSFPNISPSTSPGLSATIPQNCVTAMLLDRSST